MNIYRGIVQKGGAYGHMLGFPTANIPFDGSVSGIYIAEIVVDGRKYQSAVYADTKKKLLEIHILDFDGDLYGKEITVELLEKIREEVKFKDMDEAKSTIAADVTATRAYFTGGD